MTGSRWDLEGSQPRAVANSNGRGALEYVTGAWLPALRCHGRRPAPCGPVGTDVRPGVLVAGRRSLRELAEAAPTPPEDNHRLKGRRPRNSRSGLPSRGSSEDRAGPRHRTTVVRPCRRLLCTGGGTKRTARHPTLTRGGRRLKTSRRRPLGRGRTALLLSRTEEVKP